MPTNLQDQIKTARATIKTDAYSMSIGEWISLYQGDEIDIHPEFQRFYRWTPVQKARFIESILLGIPIPPIFVAQNEEGVWDVVDGLQRLSTIFEFAGILKDENDELLPPLVLQGTKYLPSLENKQWDDPDDPENSLTPVQRLYIKREKFSVSIILRESDERAQYELFQRLNTGGSLLSMQEVRNCIIVMLNREFYFWLKDLASDRHFQDCIALTDKALLKQYDLELALRFIIFRRMAEDDLSTIRDVGEFLTDTMVELIRDEQLDLDEEGVAFRTTFEVIDRSLGVNAFRRYDVQRQRYYGGFILSAFEVVALGIGYHGGCLAIDDEELVPVVEGIWSKEFFQQWSGSGVRGSTRIPKLIPLGRQTFSP